AVALKVAVDGRVTSARTSRVDDDGLRSLVDGAIEAAALQPVDGDWPGVSPPEEIPQIDEHYDVGTAEATPEERSTIVADFIDAGDGLVAAGYCDTEATDHAFANSRGHSGKGRMTRATVDGIQQTDTSAGSAHQTSVALHDLAGDAAGILASQRARDSAAAYDIKPGEYEVVLAPECVATIAIFLGFYGFNGKAVNEGQSFVDTGALQFDEAVELVDDSADPRALGLAFDAEGTPKRRHLLIGDGVTGDPVHDRRTGGKAGTASTGHSIAGGEAWGAIPTNMFFRGGSEHVENLIADVERGLYVSTFNYCRILDPKSQVVTGLTRNGTFMIENGAVTGAVTNLRFTQSFVDALAPGRVLGVADDGRFADSEFGPGLVHAPTVRLAGWNFTGGAEG
ncbi:MAG: TldD/PmbA family protein, partial [Acidimicrobiia bacterium]|nr:TldD/PmbA family protein [Acidimicrobiia bacterium]